METECEFYGFDQVRAVVNETCSPRAAIRRALAELPSGSPGVVAVSGGPDSVALLRALLLETTVPLVAAHVNHQLRGAESDEDEAFVRRLPGELGASATRLQVRCERLDARSLAGGDNLENAARRLRYAWLTQVARDIGAAWVATGHTADDRAETTLHRLLRGTGLRGLASIPPRRPLAPGIDVVRPLLGVRRAEIIAFLRELGQPCRHDSSNSDPRFTRNRLRHELLPLLTEAYNPAVVEVLNHLADQAEEVHGFVARQAAVLLSAAELPRAGAKVVLDVRLLAEAPPVLSREALRILWEREGWPLAEMGFDAWQRAAGVIRDDPTAVDFPGGVRMRRVGRVLQIGIYS